jgi:hypothetical protein
MDALVNALRKIGQMDCTIHIIITIFFGIIGLGIFLVSRQMVQENPDKTAWTPERVAYMGSFWCILYCVLSFIVLSTDWGCAVVAIRNASRML